MDVGPATIALVWVLIGFSCLIVITRMIMRLRGLALEDYLMFVSMGLAIVYGILTSLLYGIDQRQLHLSAAYDSPEFAKILYVSHATGFLAPLFSRISFCLYMLRIISTVFASRKRILQLLMTLQVAANVTVTILIFTRCGSFRPSLENRMQRIVPSCIRDDILEALALTAVTVNAITDLYLTILPAIIVLNIQFMTIRAKLGLFATLGLSFFATVASVSKIYYVYALFHHKNTLHVNGRLIIVMAVEINVVIIAASIPVIAPLFLHGRSRESIHQEHILPTYEARIESISEGKFLHLATLVGRPPTGNTIVIKPDPGSKIASSRVGLDKNPQKDAHAQSLEIFKTVSVAVDILEQEQDAVLEREIVPQSLHNKGSTEDSDVTLSLQAWDELPTPLFLSENTPPSCESQ